MNSGCKNISSGEMSSALAVMATFVGGMQSGFQVAMLRKELHYPVRGSTKVVPAVTTSPRTAQKQ